MSTATPPRPTTAAPAVPALVEGQRLDQPTFHERYEAMPPGTRAELINGVVWMPSPLGPAHAEAHVPPLVWLSYYEENTPGVRALDNPSTAMGPRSEPQPDAMLRILPEYGGRTQTDRRFVRGVPELIVEVSHTSRYNDLGPKLDDYERACVLEYVVRALEPDEVIWHVLQEGRLVPVPPDADGLYRSRVFPGLWLDPAALLARDTRRLRAVVDLGVATPEHAAFVARLAEARGPV
jgi:Uma2 family endonuclease